MLSSPAEISGQRDPTGSFRNCRRRAYQAKASGPRTGEGGSRPTLRWCSKNQESGRALALSDLKLCACQGEAYPQLCQGNCQERAVRLRRKVEWRVFAKSQLPARDPEGDWLGGRGGHRSEFVGQPSTGRLQLLCPPLQPPASLVPGPENPLRRRKQWGRWV